MPHRYFTGEIGGGRAALTGADAHHLAHVMRAHVGDTVLLCGPDALEYTEPAPLFDIGSSLWFRVAAAGIGSPLPGRK